MKVSVIIATYNRSNDLQKCLQALAKQNTSSAFNYEVLVVDNNSTDNTKEIISKFMEQKPGIFHYLFESQQGKCFALNKAIGMSKGNFLAFTDDDAIVDISWLENLIKCFEIENCDVIGGRIIPIYPAQTPKWVTRNIDLLTGMIVLHDYGTETKAYQKSMYEPLGANYAFKHHLFNECGLFRTDIGPGQGTYGDDTEIIKRFTKLGKKIIYCGSAKVFHPVEMGRAKLSYVIRWNMALGKYRVITNETKFLKDKQNNILGVPQDLIKEILKNILRLVINIFNERLFLENLINFSRNLGQALQIRKMYFLS